MQLQPDQGDWVSPACTLPTAEQPIRVAEFDQLFRSSARAIRRPDRKRLDVILDPGAEAVARELSERESRCCSFFTFDFAVEQEGLMMRVGVPANHVEVLDAFASRALAAIEAAG
ncbi:hypothetical protein [Nocardia ignorata]|uniref:Arsenate reductase n=1 Tax=Nocardia ignorata TaxID=145285 RepID=A0A4V6PUK6_NOCIG|nr:hypothetical protein [Nocardia ignorata]TDP32912.1 hypothetical protein DFR75_105150 [Nocardia ignorata]